MADVPASLNERQRAFHKSDKEKWFGQIQSIRQAYLRTGQVASCQTPCCPAWCRVPRPVKSAHQKSAGPRCSTRCTPLALTARRPVDSGADVESMSHTALAGRKRTGPDADRFNKADVRGSLVAPPSHKIAARCGWLSPQARLLDRNIAPERSECPRTSLTGRRHRDWLCASPASTSPSGPGSRPCRMSQPSPMTLIPTMPMTHLRHAGCVTSILGKSISPTSVSICTAEFSPP